MVTPYPWVVDGAKAWLTLAYLQGATRSNRSEMNIAFRAPGTYGLNSSDRQLDCLSAVTVPS